MEHRGELLEKAIRNSGVPITVLAKRIKKSRRHIYNLFENANIPLETLLEIGKIINHDFTLDLPKLSQFVYTLNPNEIPKSDLTSETIEYWKNKYIDLLEKHNILLSKFLSITDSKQ